MHSEASHDILGFCLKSTMCVITWVEQGAAMVSAGLLESRGDRALGECVGFGTAGSLRWVFDEAVRVAAEVGEMSPAPFLGGASRRDLSSERLQKHESFLRKERRRCLGGPIFEVLVESASRSCSRTFFDRLESGPADEEEGRP